jgi:selenocysteine lyase/cysteine desulfurase
LIYLYSSSKPIVNLKVAEKFIDAGADIILVPAVGFYYGIREERIREIVEYVHSKGKLVMSAIGTS